MQRKAPIFRLALTLALALAAGVLCLAPPPPPTSPNLTLPVTGFQLVAHPPMPIIPPKSHRPRQPPGAGGLLP